MGVGFSDDHPLAVRRDHGAVGEHQPIGRDAGAAVEVDTSDNRRARGFASVPVKPEIAHIGATGAIDDQNWLAEVSQKLSEQMQKLADAREKLNKARLRHQLVELHANRDATVLTVAKVSVGSVLQSGDQFITLVPTKAPLEVEANIVGHDGGFVQVGVPVAVKFDTFPFSQYGMAEGSVRTISPDAFTAQSDARNPTSALPVLPSVTEPFYRARISIDRLALHDVPAGFRLIPGMPITADIKVGQRTVLGYLLGLVMPVAHEAMREP